MMPYLFVARTHARSLCVHPNFQATTRATSDNFVACRSRCRSLCVHTLIVMPNDGLSLLLSSVGRISFNIVNYAGQPEDQALVHMTFTPLAIESVVKESLHLNHHVKEETSGPRYCPSIESKLIR